MTKPLEAPRVDQPARDESSRRDPPLSANSVLAPPTNKPPERERPVDAARIKDTAIRGAENITPEIKGWCPGALRPMLSGDGLLVRLRPPSGRLTQAQATGIARLAAEHGNGLIDLSARGNLQLRGVAENAHAPLTTGLMALGLIDASPEQEAVRNITIGPFWQEGDGMMAISASLAARLADAAAGVTGATRPVVTGAIEAAHPKGRTVTTSTATEAPSAAGAMETARASAPPRTQAMTGAIGPKTPDAGKTSSALVLDEDVSRPDGNVPGASWIDPAGSTAYASGNKLTLPGKFGFVIDIGATPVLRHVSADIRIERSAIGTLLCRADGATHGAAVTEADAAEAALSLARWFIATGGSKRMAAHLATGIALPERFTRIAAASAPPPPAPRPGLTPHGVLLGLPFGQIEATTLAALAAIAPIRVTPWRMLLLEGVMQTPDLPDLVTSPNDPLLRVVACVGAPQCGQAMQPTRELARRLAPHIPEGSMLHLSGCAKGCALPGPAALTLVGCTDGFALVRSGTAAMAGDTRLTAEALQSRPGLLREGDDASSL